VSPSPSRLALTLGAVLLVGCAAPAPAQTPRTLVSPSPSLEATAGAAVVPTPVPNSVSGPSPSIKEHVPPILDSVPIGAGTVVQTLADAGLRMRSKPSTDADSYKYEPLLALGAPLVILDGPVSGSGYEWYVVAPLSAAGAPYGWVASASREGEPWIEPAEFSCPAAPTTMRELIDLPPGVGVACFPNTPITVRARLLSCNCDIDGPGYEPSWFGVGSGDLLVEPDRTSAQVGDHDSMLLTLDPAGAHPDTLPVGEVVELTGVYDHPAASSCTVITDTNPEPSQDCRLRFVVTEYGVEGPLCCRARLRGQQHGELAGAPGFEPGTP
jgi:hypothetical protein